MEKDLGAKLDMKKIMYIQNVPWSWIKQRPHFIAEELSSYFDVTVYSKKAYNKAHIVENKTIKVKIKEVFRLPFERFFFVEKLSSLIIANQLSRKIKNYDIIWLSDARMYIFIKKYISENQKIIFDCMDDYAEFPMIKNSRSALSSYLKSEKILINDSDFIFVSSAYLLSILKKRHNVEELSKFKIINNAIQFKPGNEKKIDIVNENRAHKVITYIGTISEWMDFELILKSLEHNEMITYHFYGPKDIEIPVHKRLIYKGILEHERIFEVMRQSDMLVMPFKLTQLVLSVDPVKLYEYIQSDKPCIAIRYAESERFSTYVHLYSDEKEYLKLIDLLTEGLLNPLSDIKDVKKFLHENTWENRVKGILDAMKVEGI